MNGAAKGKAPADVVPHAARVRRGALHVALRRLLDKRQPPGCCGQRPPSRPSDGLPDRRRLVLQGRTSRPLDGADGKGTVPTGWRALQVAVSVHKVMHTCTCVHAVKQLVITRMPRSATCTCLAPDVTLHEHARQGRSPSIPRGDEASVTCIASASLQAGSTRHAAGGASKDSAGFGNEQVCMLCVWELVLGVVCAFALRFGLELGLQL